MRWPGRRRNPFAGRDFLDLVPARAVAHEAGDDAAPLVLLVPRFRDPVGRRLLQPRLPAARRWIRVRLDARGARIWRAIDGRTPLRALIPVYEEAFPGDTGEAAERLCRWAYAGYENGFITFVNIAERSAAGR